MPGADVVTATVRDACPRCGAIGLQRWETARARPGVSWSRCVRCDGIAVWERGRLEHPPLATSASTAALDATRAEAAALRERAAAALGERYRELVLAELAAARAASFIASYERYREGIAAPGRGLDMSRGADDAGADTPLNDD